MSKINKALQVLFGYDFGYYTYKSLKIKWFIKSVFFIRGLISCAAILYFFNEVDPVSGLCGILYATKHFIYVIFFTFIRSESTLNTFEREIREIDRVMKCESAFWFVEKRKIVLCLLNYLFRLFTSMFFCFLSLTSCWEYFAGATILVVLGLGFDTVLVSVAFVLYSIYHRLVIFETYLRLGSYDVVFFHRLYKKLADAIEKFSSIYEHVNLLLTLFNVPLVMIAIYNSVWMFKHGYNDMWVSLFVSNILTIIALLLTFTPALFAGKVSIQTGIIKKLLHDTVLFEKNELKCRDIEKLIDYMEARPLKFTVYKVIPLDASLLGMVFNFCVTYLIVIIQFSHLY